MCSETEKEVVYQNVENRDILQTNMQPERRRGKHNNELREAFQSKKQRNLELVQSGDDPPPLRGWDFFELGTILKLIESYVLWVLTR